MSETRYADSVDPVVTDGRDIDLELGELSGEGGQQAAGAVDAHLAQIAQPWRQMPTVVKQDPTYYGLPVLKAPVWGWEVPLYYFTGGAAGASLVLGAAAQLDPSGALQRLTQRCHWVGIIGSTISGVLLIGDLGRPSRFLNMLRVFRPTSPMNMGAWILSGAAPTAITAGMLAHRKGFWGALGKLSGYASGIFGMGLATYTGVLVGNSAIPLWQSSRRILPILFGASGMASAASLFDLLLEEPRERRVTYTFGTIGRVAEITAAIVMERQAPAAVSRPLRLGTSGLLWKAATLLTAASLITSLLPKSTRKKRVTAGVLGMAGSLALRYAVHHAGTESARDPRATFHSQRD